MLAARPIIGIGTPVIASSTMQGCYHSYHLSSIAANRIMTNTMRRRTFSSLPHHLARKNNGMVNVFVKSTKVPRPPVVVTMVPPDFIPPSTAIHGMKPNLKNQLKQQMKQAMNASRILLNDESVQQNQQHYFSYAGNANIPITSKLKIVLPGEDVPRGIWPAFRMMDEHGRFLQSDNSNNISAPDASPTTNNHLSPEKYNLSQLQSILTLQYPHFTKEIQSSALLTPSKHEYADTNSTNTLLRAHRQMIRLRKMDTILHNAQRQGRISFYMTHHGEEAIHMGSGSALQPQDYIFAQYREAGLLMWRGFTLEQFCNQCFSNDLDLGKGRQMPVHYGCRALNYQTISSPLGTQITHAVGAAYKFKLDAIVANNSEKEKKTKDEAEAAISIVYFGDGAASTVDFHSGCNFAATLKTPMIFFCRNNGYAISTPVTDQYAGDGIISRAPGYGMAGIRVDGNDIFAVHAAVAEARKVALETSSPVMIEAMTYRQGHHSTSDDSSRYRDTDEVQKATVVSDPILRLDRFLKQYHCMDDTSAAAVEDEERVAVLRAMEVAEARGKPKLETMFTDVYHTKPSHLIRQELTLKRHLKKYSIAQRKESVCQ